MILTHGGERDDWIESIDKQKIYFKGKKNERKYLCVKRKRSCGQRAHETNSFLSDIVEMRLNILLATSLTIHQNVIFFPSARFVFSASRPFYSNFLFEYGLLRRTMNKTNETKWLSYVPVYLHLCLSVCVCVYAHTNYEEYCVRRIRCSSSPYSLPIHTEDGEMMEKHRECEVSDSSSRLNRLSLHGCLAIFFRRKYSWIEWE